MTDKVQSHFRDFGPCVLLLLKLETYINNDEYVGSYSNTGVVVEVG